MRTILILAASAALLACQPAADVAEDVTEDGMTPAASADTPSADVAGAETFVRALYARYDADPMSVGEMENVRWSARAQALWDANAEAAGGEVGYLGADPICACQDWGDLSITSVDVTPTGDARADAAVVFSNFGETTRQTLKLVNEGGEWRVDDIVWGEGHMMAGEPSMAEGLQQSTAELAAVG